MDMNRMVLLVLVEVVKSLVKRLGFFDLVEQCEACERGVQAGDETEKKEG